MDIKIVELTTGNLIIGDLDRLETEPSLLVKYCAFMFYNTPYEYYNDVVDNVEIPLENIFFRKYVVGGVSDNVIFHSEKIITIYDPIDEVVDKYIDFFGLM